MFQSTIISRFQHLYLLQAFIEIQRLWNQLYSKLKHRVLIIVDKRLRSNLVKSLRGKIPIRRKRPQEDRESIEPPYEFVVAEQRGLFQDLNTILASPDQQQQSSVSVPMQLLMMPMLVQPCSLGSQASLYTNSVNPTLEEFVTAQRQQLRQPIMTAAHDRTCAQRPTYKTGWSSIGDVHNIYRSPSSQTMRNLIIS